MPPMPDNANQPPAQEPLPNPVQSPIPTPPENPIVASPASETSASIPSTDPTPPEPISSTAFTGSDSISSANTPPVVVGVDSAASTGGKPVAVGSSQGSGMKKWLLPVVIVFVILLGGSAVAYVSYYLPNQPSNIWGTALKNTNSSYNQLLSYLNKQTTARYKGFSETGSFKGSFVGMTADGSLNGSSDGNNATFSAKIDAASVKVDLEARSIKAAGNDEPDIYFQLSGIRALGASTGLNLSSVDGKWVVVDHTLLDTLKSQLTQSGTSSKFASLTSADVLSIFQAIGATNSQYVWTTDSNKAVASVSKDIGKETQDGRSVYHYKVSFNKDHVKSYITSLRNNLNSSAFGKWLKSANGQSIDTYIDYQGMLNAADRIKNTDMVDVWVDMSTKTIHKIRFSDSTDPINNYFDIGLNYNGGSQYPLVLSVHSKQSSTITTASLTTTLDTKANSLTLALNFNQSGNTASNLSLNATFKPSNDIVKLTAPSGAIPITQLLQQFGLPSDFLSGGLGSATPTANSLNDFSIQ